MSAAQNRNLKPRQFYLVFALIAVLAGYLRLDQFGLQVLLDDEWHAIHQLLARTPAELVRTFGLADFSIPLALFYWLESRLFGLSEMAMRWPMMLAGIAFVGLAALYLRRYVGDKAALIFMLLAALSPRLILYSKTARPYALTLLISMVAIGLFLKFVSDEERALKWAALYIVCAVICTWLHIISLPMVVAPFAAIGLPALFKRQWRLVGRLFKLGLVTLGFLLLVVLPPLLGDVQALAIKMGSQLPGLQTMYGSLFSWLGTSSTPVVVFAGLLALAGIGRAWREVPLVPCILVGLVLTVLMIVMSQPAWVQYPLTLSRYLLAGLPLLLLAITLGALRLDGMLVRAAGLSGRVASLGLHLALLGGMLLHSPLPDMLRKPNSNLLHAAYQFDYRKHHNLVVEYQQRYPLSPFWQQLAKLPADSIRIAATPFSFESHHWDAARWEQVSRQRVMPGFLTGFCDGFWWGEVPRNEYFRFQNAGYLSDQADLLERGFDILVFQKPVSLPESEDGQGFALTAARCETRIRAQFPEPVFEDQWLVVIPLSEKVRRLIDAKR